MLRAAHPYLVTTASLAAAFYTHTCGSEATHTATQALLIGCPSARRELGALLAIAWPLTLRQSLCLLPHGHSSALCHLNHLWLASLKHGLPTHQHVGFLPLLPCVWSALLLSQHVGDHGNCIHDFGSLRAGWSPQHVGYKMSEQSHHQTRLLEAHAVLSHSRLLLDAILILIISGVLVLYVVIQGVVLWCTPSDSHAKRHPPTLFGPHRCVASPPRVIYVLRPHGRGIRLTCGWRPKFRTWRWTCGSGNNRWQHESCVSLAEGLRGWLARHRRHLIEAEIGPIEAALARAVPPTGPPLLPKMALLRRSQTSGAILLVHLVCASIPIRQRFGVRIVHPLHPYFFRPVPVIVRYPCGCHGTLTVASYQNFLIKMRRKLQLRLGALVASFYRFFYWKRDNPIFNNDVF